MREMPMKDMKNKRNAFLEKLALYSNMVRGTITSVCARCSRANCICGKRTARKAYRLTYKDRRQKTQIMYIPQSRLPEARRMIANYYKSRKILEQLIETNIQIFKNGTGN
jgi:hypothetical protein